MSDTYPHFGFIVSFPESIEIEERRGDVRTKMPEFVSAEFSLKKGREKDKVYDLNVLDVSSHGLGLLITKKDFDLLQILNEGDKVENITFYATTAMIQVNAAVAHKTEIEHGEYKGCYILGLKSEELIQGFMPEGG